MAHRSNFNILKLFVGAVSGLASLFTGFYLFVLALRGGDELNGSNILILSSINLIFVLINSSVIFQREGINLEDS